MQRNVLKHQFENFTTTPNESLAKAYDRFQKLISQLEVYAAPVSKEDINQKFLRSLSPSWSQIALIIRNNQDINQTNIDDLYNNLGVYEDEMKRSSSSTSNSHNLAFLSSENTNSTNEVSPVSGNFGIDQDDLEELDLRWQVAMLTVRGTLLGSANQEGTKGKGLMVIMEGGMSDQVMKRSHQQMIGLDEYTIRKKIIETQTTELKTDTSESKTSETVGNTNEVKVEKPKSVYESVVLKPMINRDKVIIEDWNSDDEDDVSKVETVSPVKTNETQKVKTQVDKIGQISQKKGIGFKKIKACFVYKRVLTRTGLVNPVRPNGKRAVHTVSTAKPVSIVRPACTGIKNMTTAGTRAVVSTGKGKMDNVLKKSRWVWKPKGNHMDHESKESRSFILNKFEYADPKGISKSVDYAVLDSGCSSHMTSNKAYLLDYEDYNGGFVAFGSDPKGGKITGKGKIRTANLDFDDVCFVDELKFNLLYVSQMCYKKNSVLFTDTECLILSPSFKLLDESQVVLRAPRQNDVYSLDLKNIVSFGGEFKNHAMNELCAKKGIKRDFSMAKTPRKNGVAERKNRTLIEAARTMLADSLLPIPFWAEAVNTACYTLGKLMEINEGILHWKYFTTSKAFRVYNKRTKRVEENMHINFFEDQPNVAGIGHDWMFDLDFLTNTMNYIPVSVENQTAPEKPSENAPKHKDVQDSEVVAEKEDQDKLKEAEQALKYDLERMVAQEMAAKAMYDATRQAFEEEKRKILQKRALRLKTSINKLNNWEAICANDGESLFIYLGEQIHIDASALLNVDLPTDPKMPDLEDDSDVFPNDGMFSRAFDDEDMGAKLIFNPICVNLLKFLEDVSKHFNTS
ncbi:ribonuclease H-like domain-containing protein [Tanacetum coccineum]